MSDVSRRIEADLRAMRDAKFCEFHMRSKAVVFLFRKKNC